MKPKDPCSGFFAPLRMTKMLYMKKIILIIGVTILCVGIVNYLQSSDIQPQALWKGYETQKMILEDTEYTLVIADTPDHMQKGLMFVRKPTEGFDGMVFRFPDKQIRTFWNKNTLEDLQLYWMADGEVIGTSDLPSIEKSVSIVTVSSPAPADTVVEIIK